MRNFKRLLIASVVATAIVGLPAYSQNARVSRGENLQKRETQNTNAPTERVTTAKRPGYTERPSNGGSIGGGAVAAPTTRPSNGGGIGSGAGTAAPSRPSNGGGIGSGATTAPNGNYDNNQGRRPGNNGGGIGSGAGTAAPSRPSNGGGIGSGAAPAPSGNYDNNQGRRPGNNGGGIGSGATPNRPGNNGGGIGSGATPNRPGNNGGGIGSGATPNRPGNNGGGIGSGATPNRPNHNNNNGYRPGGGGVSRPGNDHPNGYYTNDRNYDRHYHNGNYVSPPARPYRPYCRPVPRPVCPPSYRPYASARYINNILGLAFGVSYIASLDYLYDNGYSVDGYDNNVVYLRNVNEMSYNWPDATLNYGNSGQLSNMQFTYSTSYGSTSRYERLYRELCRYYGSPVTYTRTANGITGVWYGAGQRNYVSLEYDMEYVNGSVRYYTILSYGY